MAAPNIVNVTTITAKTDFATLTTVMSNVVVNAAGSGTVTKINTIQVSNATPVGLLTNVIVRRSTVNNYLGGNLAIPSFSTLIVSAKDTSFYLEEGDQLMANVNSNVAVSISSSYEIIS